MDTVLLLISKTPSTRRRAISLTLSFQEIVDTFCKIRIQDMDPALAKLLVKTALS